MDKVFRSGLDFFERGGLVNCLQVVWDDLLDELVFGRLVLRDLHDFIY